MEEYTITGVYPDKKEFTARVIVENIADAATIAYGLTEVTQMKNVKIIDEANGITIPLDEVNPGREYMEKYTIKGDYPDGDTMTLEVNAQSCMDAFTVAQGLRKVTELKKITVTSNVMCIRATF